MTQLTGLAPETSAPARLDVTIYRTLLAARLHGVLASTYHLAFKSYLYRWAALKPPADTLAQLAATQYGALLAGAEAIVERLEDLGQATPQRPTTTPDFSEAGPRLDMGSALDILQDLLSDHEAALRAIAEAEGLAGEAGDALSSDILAERRSFHQQALHDLRATLAH